MFSTVIAKMKSVEWRKHCAIFCRAAVLLLGLIAVFILFLFVLLAFAQATLPADHGVRRLIQAVVNSCDTPCGEYADQIEEGTRKRDANR